ncbi:MAG: hypothetical protein A3J07_04465 [Candidatus Doudnabacteria bacterium RIFCSPLOWO2_02_FULL_49_13]|uniref:Uncharacterized protein n=1 Tax=Candidatus Doudnabacteria bacterium RIFCSPHIGHO2_12_FULL_48_16 TaxID=1817838 RepID=A0A1F5PKG9_9BACT|nr:MAG: hypothetical protein A3E29_03600 [Candidatus Doudnabacteria bacterium RIFCSPHIGHO2_12_FULL_48_16]OGF03306.1 MAG: hypothetical protein A3J07_04465 [Candidatus Doudnabacteria bacterium RIFCSPLOWO2_02_FULL_49_13]
MNLSDIKFWTVKNKTIIAGLVVLVIAGVAMILYFGQPEEITEPVEITADQRARVEAVIAELQTKIKTCDQASDPSAEASAKEDDHKCSDLYLQLGLNHESLGQVSRAIYAYEQAAKADSNLYVPYSNLGSIYRRLKDYAKAEESFRKALTIAPNNASVYTKLIEMSWYDLKKRPHEMEPLFQEAFKATDYEANLVRFYAYYGHTINDPLIEINAWTAILQYEPDNAAAKKSLEAAQKSAREQGLIQ